MRNCCLISVKAFACVLQRLLIMLIAAFDILLCGICSVYVKFSHNSFLTHFILIVFQYFSKFRAPVIDLSVVVCLTIATILHKPTKLQDFTHLYVDQM